MKSTERVVPDSRYGSQIPRLVESLLRQEVGDEAASIYAIAAVQNGGGASTVAMLIAKELALHPERRILLATAAELNKLRSEDLNHLERCWGAGEHPGVMRIVVDTERRKAANVLTSDHRFMRALIQKLRQSFTTVLVDAADLLTSQDIPRLAPFVDGVIVVVQAGRSTRAQVEYGLRVLSLAGGNLKGMVLNRRTYPIPDNIYRWLRS